MRKNFILSFVIGVVCVWSALPAFAEDEDIKIVERDGITYKLTKLPEYVIPLTSYASVIAKTDGTPYLQEEISFTVEITEDDESYVLREIKAGAFKDAVNLKKIDIPASITSIERNAFNNCPNLSEINMQPNGGWMEPVCYISSFTNCPSLKEIHFNQTLFIYDDQSSGLEAVEKVYFEQSCTLTKPFDVSPRTGDYPVKPNMTIDWGTSKIYIDDESMTWFTGEWFTVTGNTQFTGGSSIGAKHVKVLEFKEMQKGDHFLSYIWPFTVAFSDCNLTTIIFNDESLLQIPADLVFDNPEVKDNITLYVPRQSLDNFKNHAVWGTYSKILPIEDGIGDVEADFSQMPVEYFNLQGVKVEKPTQGTTVIRRQGNSTEKVIVH